MTLEATIVCIDNSEWTRNGDYAPTRFQAQSDTIAILATKKTDANPESTVGILTMAGKTPRVLVTPTGELGKILSALQMVEIEGESNLASAVQVAQLALKHRQNKNQRQRIVIFIGSPIQVEKEKLVKIGKNLKKNNVAVDIVAIGHEDENSDKVAAFKDAVNSNGNSNLVTVPAGVILLDVLTATPVFRGEGAGYGAGAGDTGNGDFIGGVDPNIDPELALALRVSMEEERARQAAAAQAAQGGPSGPPAEGDGAAFVAGDNEPLGPEDDDLLQQAIAMSMQVDHPAPSPAPAPVSAAPEQPPAPQQAGDISLFDDDGFDDEDLRLALQMSLGDAPVGGAPLPSADTRMAEVFDSDYVSSVLESLPGVDVNDPAVQTALAALQNLDEDMYGEEEKKDTDEKDKK